jgi:anti-sigma-K factor RskA
MSGCPTHGPLVGGYALGALEPEEMEEMRRHVAVCPHCGPEADRLASLPGLLDRIVPADVPPPTLSPQVEEAVLDRFARERGEEAAEEAATRPRLRPRRRRAAAAPRRPAAIRRGPLAVAAAGLVALVVALTLLLPSDERGAYASASLDPMAGGSGSATAQIGQVSAGTGIRLQARGLPVGSEYEVWCIRSDGRWVSGGTFWPESNGEAQAYMTAAVRPGDYHRIVVTRNPDRGSERGPAVLSGDLQY